MLLKLQINANTQLEDRLVTLKNEIDGLKTVVKEKAACPCVDSRLFVEKMGKVEYFLDDFGNKFDKIKNMFENWVVNKFFVALPFSG